jgi:hypothetical protein
MEHHGSCHCGRIKFKVEVTKYEAIDCNCSMCRKRGFLHLIVPESAFTLVQGEDAITEYRFNTGTARHMCCKVCGVQPFYRPRSHPDSWDVNVHALDDKLDFTVVPFDGQNWEANIEKIRA